MCTREEVATFVASLAIPEDRREVVLAELLDHLASAGGDGADPAFGDLTELRARLEKIEPSFQFGIRAGLVRAGATSAALVAAAALVRFVGFSLPLGTSPGAEVLAESLPLLVRGALLTVLFFLVTPSVVWAQLAAAHRAGGLRRGWLRANPAERAVARRAAGAILYFVGVLYGATFAAMTIEDLLGLDDFAAPVVMPVTIGFFTLLVGSIRLRRGAARGIPVE